MFCTFSCVKLSSLFWQIIKPININQQFTGWQGCALAVPGDPRCLTFALGWLENLSFFLTKLYAGHPGFLKFRVTVLGSLHFFIEHSLYWIVSMLKHFDKTSHWNIGFARNIVKSLWYRMVIHSNLIMLIYYTGKIKEARQCIEIKARHPSLHCCHYTPILFYG